MFSTCQAIYSTFQVLSTFDLRYSDFHVVPIDTPSARSASDGEFDIIIAPVSMFVALTCLWVTGERTRFDSGICSSHGLSYLDGWRRMHGSHEKKSNEYMIEPHKLPEPHRPTGQVHTGVRALPRLTGSFSGPVIVCRLVFSPP